MIPLHCQQGHLMGILCLGVGFLQNVPAMMFQTTIMMLFCAPQLLSLFSSRWPYRTLLSWVLRVQLVFPKWPDLTEEQSSPIKIIWTHWRGTAYQFRHRNFGLFRISSFLVPPMLLCWSSLLAFCCWFNAIFVNQIMCLIKKFCDMAGIARSG